MQTLGSLRDGDIDPFHVNLTLERAQFNNSARDEWVPQKTFWGLRRSQVDSAIAEEAEAVEILKSHGWDIRWRIHPAFVGRLTAWTVDLAPHGAEGVREA